LIEGIVVTPLRRVANAKGEVLHALKRSSPGFVGFGEAYFSTVLAGEIKGWKRHRRVTLNLVVPVGRIRFVVHDDRAVSPTRGRFDDVTLGLDNYARMTVSPGLWVAFEGAHADLSLLLNVIDEEHDPAEADNVELGAFEFPWVRS
jgi:dTDP-4-dehydrorhamnose 3,5-epimerase